MKRSYEKPELELRESLVAITATEEDDDVPFFVSPFFGNNF